jgi:hypothetical protein
MNRWGSVFAGLTVAILVGTIAACQILADIDEKTFVPSDGGSTRDGSTSTDGVTDAADSGLLPPDCETLVSTYDQALWPLPPVSLDGTNYEVWNGTVLDKTTRLMWQQASDPEGTYDDAKCACRHLSLGGYDNWRLPSLVELMTIIDYAKNVDPEGTGTTVPATNTVVFPDTLLEAYWTATAQGKASLGPGLPVLLDFSEGETEDPTRLDAGADAGVRGMEPFRCVRSAAPPPVASRFDTGTPGIVIDNNTQLEWQAAAASVLETSSSGSGYCTGLELDGHEDWRLPNVRELASLVDFHAYPTIDANAFPDTQTGYAWVTSTPEGDDPTDAVWNVDFSSGDIYIVPSSVMDFVRCVRTMSP